MAVCFLNIDDVLQIHEDQIALYGGSAAVRDMGLLQSAIETPRASFGGDYLHIDVFAMAAAYLFHIVQNHPFVDGNKRTGTVAGLLFLDMNGIEVVTSNESLSEMTLAVATGQMTKEQVADFFRGASQAGS